MKRSISPWYKAGLAALSMSVVGATIVAFSYASDVSDAYPPFQIEPSHNASMTSPLGVSHAKNEITQQMILERTASCAEMISPKDKLRCLNKRLKMKRDFRVQEKGKCDQLGGMEKCFAELDILMQKLRSA